MRLRPSSISATTSSIDIFRPFASIDLCNNGKTFSMASCTLSTRGTIFIVACFQILQHYSIFIHPTFTMLKEPLFSISLCFHHSLPYRCKCNSDPSYHSGLIAWSTTLEEGVACFMAICLNADCAETTG